MDDAQPSPRRSLPSVDAVLKTSAGATAAARFGHPATVDAVRSVLAIVRASAGRVGDVRTEDVAHRALAVLEDRDAPTLRRVFNLTGTVLHTNLGRAVLAETAIATAIDAMRHAANIEYDLDQGQRGERDDHVRALVRELTGADDCVVVNNNAAAVLLALNQFGNGREAIVSRGELIEIGGAFRLPDIMARAGAKLIEVGTTNRTHLKDFEAALGEATGLIMKAHTSNYLIQGFSASVPASELAVLARAHKVPFIDDLGSGTLVDLSRYGLKHEPTVQEALKAGADLVTFSGDKLLGGPQVGIIAGRKDLIAKLAKNPLKRALRIDKIRMAALAATLKLYRDPDRLAQTLPTLRAFVRTRGELAEIAARLSPALASALGDTFAVSTVECASQIGSGALPLDTLPSAGVAIAPQDRKVSGAMIEHLAAAFRRAPVPVIGRLHEGALMFDLRCLDDEAAFVGQLASVARAFSERGA